MYTRISYIMITSSNGNIFRVPGHQSPVTGEFPAQKPVTQIFDVFFDQRVGTELIRINIIIIMIADVLATCVARTSAAMILTM